ncbi:MAG: type II secretion system ATPase GspE [Victivallales bacterium]|nr:type II secretion system ATPase GspE [Victivallales bacterium]
MAQNVDYILELLCDHGMLDKAQIDEGWEKVAASSGKLDIMDALKELGYVDENETMAVLAQQYGLDTLDLDGYQIPVEVIESVSSKIAQQYKIVPVMKHDDMLTVAMSDPTDMETLDSLRYVLNCDVDAVISQKSQIKKLLDLHYGTIEASVDSFLSEISGDDVEHQLVADMEKSGESLEADDAPIIRLVTLIIVEAFKQKVSDIHMEPLEKRYRVRYRLDGMLHEVEAPSKYLQGNVTSRLKIMSKLDITEKRVPQDGRIQLKIGGKDVDLRVSTIPTSHGESIVMRILDKSSIQLDIPDLGFYSDDQALINQIINMPDGIFLVTGPTGSGKTTSLYAFLNTINTPTRKIMTVEDPVEYQLAGINQVQVDRSVDLTFGAALRSMLRQAPNIIMVGEIRDLETAEIAINASLTGHLVFSTLHTNDAPGAVARLVDMGVKNFLVASSVKAVMAQRLLRRICKNCAAPTEPDPEELRLLDAEPKDFEGANLMKGRGCAECSNSGYKGRMGIYEIFMISEETQDLIFHNATTNEIRDAARKSGMRTLRDDGLRKALAGSTTLQEVIRITAMDEE